MSKFNYILNDLAFDTLVIKCLYGEPTNEDAKECENQIELLKQENQQLKEVIEEVRQLVLKQIDISNKEINKIRYIHHYDSHYKNLLIGQEQDLIKNQEKVLQILDKAKGEQNDR